MAGEETFGSTKRFGTRYGRTVKQRFGKIEQDQRALHKCPYCHKTKVKRVSKGIWSCKKCNATFTGKAYTLAKMRKVKALTTEEITDLEKEEGIVSEEVEKTEEKKEKSKKEEAVEEKETVEEDSEQEEAPKEDMETEQEETEEPEPKEE